MPIMLDLAGMPCEVPEPRINDFRRLGYRLAPTIAESTDAQPSPPSPSIDPSLINLNTASLKELVALPLVGTALAKKVIACRPYESIDDLTRKVEGVDWVSLESKLTV